MKSLPTIARPIPGPLYLATNAISPDNYSYLFSKTWKYLEEIQARYGSKREIISSFPFSSFPGVFVSIAYGLSGLAISTRQYFQNIFAGVSSKGNLAKTSDKIREIIKMHSIPFSSWIRIGIS